LTRPPHPPQDADFLSRWSRRKRGAEPEPVVGPEVPVAAPEPDAPAPGEPERTDAEILEELGLPDPDGLKMGDDFSAFMAKAVPERLRRRALRKLWGSNPVLACLDGLNDYDGDFTTPTGPAPLIATAYRVGKGFITHEEEAEVRAAAEAARRSAHGDATEAGAVDSDAASDGAAAPAVGAEEAQAALSQQDAGDGAAEHEASTMDAAGDPPRDSDSRQATAQADAGTTQGSAATPRRRMRFSV
jgi:hypothetical protein